MFRSSSKLISLHLSAVLLSALFSYAIFFGISQSFLFSSEGILGSVISLGEAPIEVTKIIPEMIFDIDVDIVTPEITQANDLKVRVQFTSFGRVPTGVELNYSVLDAAGAVRFTENEKVTVETTYVVYKNFPSLKLTDGAYTVKVETLYNTDIHDTFVKPFTVQEKQDSYVMLFVALGIFGSAGVVGLFHMFLLARGKLLRETHSFIAHNTATLVIALIMIPTTMYLFSEIETMRTMQAGLVAFNLDEKEALHADALSAYLRDKGESVQMLRTELYDVTDLHETFAILAKESYVRAIYAVADGLCVVSAYKEDGFTPKKCGPAMTVDALQIENGQVTQESNGDRYVNYAFTVADGKTYILAFSLDEIMWDIGYSGVASGYVDTR